MIDIWLFTGLFLPFVVFNILVALDILIMQEKDKSISVYAWMKDDEEKTTSKLILKVSRVLIPVITVIFCIIYWIFALTIYHIEY